MFSLFRSKVNVRPQYQEGGGPFAVAGREPLHRDGTLTHRDEQRLYNTAPSIIDFMPYAEYLPQERCILLDDGVSVGAVYEVIPVGTEGRPAERLDEIRDTVEDALQDSLPQLDSHQWVVQFYCQDETDVTEYIDRLRGYVKPWAEGSEFTKAWLAETERHMKSISVEKGLFEDKIVTGAPWRGQTRRTRMVIYRYVETPVRDQMSPVVMLNQVCDRVTSALAGASIKCHRQNGELIHGWLLRWFNPNPRWVAPDALYRSAHHDDGGPDTLPLMNDFSESLWYTRPRSDAERGIWWFDDIAHKAVPVEALRRVPQTGHLTGEVRRGDNINALMDLMPQGSMLVMTLIVQPQDVLEEQFNKLGRNAMGENVDSARAREDAQTAKAYLGARHKLYRAAITFLLRAPDTDTLSKRQLDLNSKLLNSGMKPVNPEHDVAPLNGYLRALPMSFNPELDKQHWYSRLMFVQHFAAMLPVFGRDTGTGNPGLSFFNRGGSPLTFDPMNKADRTQNAHLLLFGPTGSGKSATLCSGLSQTMALHRPRLFLLEAGNSFGLYGDYCESLGLTVNKISIKPGKGVSLAPFADSHLLLQAAPSTLITDEDKLPELDEIKNDDGDDERDVLGEMEIAARLMVTGGEAAEELRMTRADRGMLREAILIAAHAAQDEQTQMLPEHLMKALESIARDNSRDSEGRERRTAARRARAEEMSEALRMFTEGFEGELFNRPGIPWPESDVTIIDLGTLAREGYEAQMAVAVIALINTVNNIAERDQYLDREIIMVIDEAHIVTTNPLLSPYVTKVVKMWRKLGAWLWLATQNLKDFPNVSEKMLNMAEWWLCLTMPPDEVEQIARFKTLTAEQKAMLLSATKFPRCYTEGVVLSTRVQALFRSVPPSLYLALGMTEKEEKAERRELMQQFNCSELDAAFRVAKRLDVARGILSERAEIL
ncbi:conjugative transfer ATPase [Dickeya dadantii]|uniref:conjugative transfer ATPase n=1 Tax=Dickeya dadantii TaxID=204038 RepID=UPI0021D92878|nr:conjugative transfer ATPase [Dickeya dadantii]